MGGDFTLTNCTNAAKVLLLHLFREGKREKQNKKTKADLAENKINSENANFT